MHSACSCESFDPGAARKASIRQIPEHDQARNIVAGCAVCIPIGIVQVAANVRSTSLIAKLDQPPDVKW